jgi:hypothetical protein
MEVPVIWFGPRSTFGFAAVVACFAGATLAAQQPDTRTIRQQVLEDGAFERMIVSHSEPLALEELVAGADLIVEAVTIGGQACLNEAETDIYTDYPFELHAIVKDSHRAQVGDVISVRRHSGVVRIDGRTAVSHEIDFRPFEAGEHYILFLRKLQEADAYEVYGGAQGAFTSVPAVRPLSVESGTARDIARSAFLDEVRALLKGSLKSTAGLSTPLASRPLTF